MKRYALTVGQIVDLADFGFRGRPSAEEDNHIHPANESCDGCLADVDHLQELYGFEELES